VWIAAYPEPTREAAVREIVDAPTAVVPLCMLAIGHPAGALPEVDRYEPDFVRQDRWTE
jgi:hypothetical protein